MFDKVENPQRTERLVRKWMLDDICDLDRNESWFSDMAEQGLFIDHFGFWSSAWFKKGTPRRTRYRMDVLPRKLTEDELALYDSCGWHFAALDQETYWNPAFFYIFQTDENATVPELHTDPMEQAESLRKLRRWSLWDFWLGVAIPLFWIGLWVWQALYAARRFDFLVNGSVFNIYWVLFSAFAVVDSLRSGRSIRRLYKRLAGGEPLDHHADYLAAHRRYALTAYLRPLLWAVMMAVLLVQLIFSSLDQARPLPEGAPDFPAVRLAEVHDGLDGPNAVCGESYHEWTWAGAVEDRLYEYADDPETGVRLEWYTTCYRLPFVKTAALAFDALLEGDWYRGISDAYWTAAATRVETDLVDEAWAVAPGEENGWQYALYVRDERCIVMVSYSDYSARGTGDAAVTEAFRDRCTEKILPLLAARLEK